MEDRGWEKQKINTVIRYRNRGKYDYQSVNTIVDETPILHVSFSASAEEGDPPFPVILPMLGCTSPYPDPPSPDKSESRVIYLHGYVSSRILRLAKSADQNGDSPPTSNSNISTSGEEGGSGGGGGGIPICVSATQFDGVVLALTPNHHSCNYRSAVVFGHAYIVTSEPERLHAMQLITDNLVPARWSQTRYPNATELRSTGILRVEIRSASAKVRAGTTGEDRKDLADVGMREKVWAGVVPSFTVWGEPVESGTNLRKGVPGYIAEWVERENKKNEEFAYAVAK